MQETTNKATAMRANNGQTGQVVCAVCNGTGAVTHWNEVAYFEDRRFCTMCAAGREVAAKIAEIIERARFATGLRN